jgi:hypothetical protein
MVNLEYFLDYPLYIIACIPYMAIVVAYYLIFRFYVKVEYLHIIREMPKTLEDVADLGSYICALDKG